MVLSSSMTSCNWCTSPWADSDRIGGCSGNAGCVVAIRFESLPDLFDEIGVFQGGELLFALIVITALVFELLRECGEHGFIDFVRRAVAMFVFVDVLCGRSLFGRFAAG